MREYNVLRLRIYEDKRLHFARILLVSKLDALTMCSCTPSSFLEYCGNARDLCRFDKLVLVQVFLICLPINSPAITISRLNI